MAAAYDPLDPVRRRDPYPAHHALRREDPVHRSALMGAWVLSRHADVVAVLRDPNFRSARDGDLTPQTPMPAMGAELEDVGAALKRSVIFADPPRHTRLRALLAPALAPRAIARLRERIQAHVDALLDAVADAGAIDVVRDLAVPLPLMVIADLLGVPDADRPALHRWSEDLGAALDPFVPPEVFVRAGEAALAMHAYFRDRFAERRRHPSSDLVGTLLSAPDVSELDAFAMCALVVGAGHRTTTNFLANAVLLLVAHPDERRRLVQDPDLMTTALDEFLRYESPVQAIARVPAEACTVGGQRIEAGDWVILLLGAANRDPAEFPDPDRLDLGRRPNRHVGLGAGIHTCPGAQLAYLEGEIAIGTLLRHFPDLGGDVRDVEWEPVVVSRSLRALPLGFTPSARRRAR